MNAETETIQPPPRYPFLRGAFFLAVSKGSFLVFTFLLYAFLVRVLPRDQINAFGIAMTFVNLLLLALDLGFTDVGTRKFAKLASECELFLRAGLVTKSVIGFGLFWVFAAVTYCIYPDALTRQAVLLSFLIAFLRSASEFIEGILIGQGRAAAVCAFTLTQSSLIFISSAVIAVWFNKSATVLLGVQAAAIALTLLVRFCIVTGMKVRGAWVRGMWPMARASLIEGIPFGIAQGFQAIVFTAPSIIISLLPEVKDDLAVFQGAHRINVSIYTLCGTLGTSLYASISSAIANNDRESIHAQMTKTLHMLSVASFAWAVTVFIFGNDVAHFVYSNKLPFCGTYLGLMALGVPFGFIGYIPMAVLPAADQEKTKMNIIVASAILAWPILYFTTKYWGLYGTSWANTTIYAGQCVAMFVAQRLILGSIPNLLGIWRIALSACAMTGVYLILKGRIPDLLLVMIGLSVYGACLLLAREHEMLGIRLREKASVYFKRLAMMGGREP